MFGWLKKRRAYQLGQQTASTIVQEINDRIAGRVMPASERFIDVLRQRLAMIWDEPSVGPRNALRAQWSEFEKELDTFLGEMRAEINIKTYKWDEVIDGVGMREPLDQLIRERLTTVKNNMMQEAAAIIANVVSEIERREKHRSNPQAVKNQPSRQQPSSSLDEPHKEEAEKVMRVKILCQSANGSAEAVAQGSDDAEWLDYERNRFEKHRMMALELAETITDDFYRAAAFHQAIDLCMCAGDRDAAKSVFRSVRVDLIREQIIEAHPTIR